MKKHFLTILALLLIATMAQANDTGDFMRETGKIYVVVAVIVVIFAGVALYLWRLDRRLSQLEHQIKDSDERKN
jgi:CcmD family protein